MDDSELSYALNKYISTEDGVPITPLSGYFQQSIRDSILMHNQTQYDILVQAFIGRYFMRSGEKIVVSLANRRINRREIYSDLKHALLEMMLVVSITTLAYVLVKMNGG
jgi:hypothetical protein